MPIMAESKDQVFVDEQEIILHLQWVWWASKQKARAHVTSRLGNYSALRGAGMFSLYPAFTSSLVYSTYKSSTQQNAALTGQDRQGYVQLKVC